jgi:two-component system chemotaxis sensor kinase CheA
MASSISKEVADEILESFVQESSVLLRRIEELLGQCARAEAAQQEALWLEVRRALHTLKGAAAAAGIEAFKLTTHLLEDRIGATPNADPRTLDGLLDDLKQLWELIPRRSAAADAKPSAEAPAPAPMPDGDYLRMRPERIDALHTLAGELVVTRLQQAALAERLKALRDQTEETQRMFRRLDMQLRHARGGHGRTPWDELVGNSRTVAGLLAQTLHEIDGLSRELPALNEQAAVVSANLEDGIRELRLMPLQPFFREYTQVLREAARESGKRATLQVRAEGAEIDRSVLLRLREPLLHLVRNAVVHGIEPPEQRLARGKPEAGCVSLEARSEGTRVFIRVSDDGCGVDVAAVRRQAQRMHLLDVGEEMAEDALLDLLSQPGFSTHQQADGLAGRGIGLDVARNSIHSLGGRLGLSTQLGLGSTFTIEVPISASTSIGLLLRIGSEVFGVLLNQIERVLRVAADEIKVFEGRDTVEFYGDKVAAITLAELLGRPLPATPATRLPAVVLRLGKQRLLLLVDDIPGEQALVIKPLGRAFANARLFVGGAIQADHSIVPVLQVAELFERAVSRQRTARAAGKTAANRHRRGSVLVVDDSLTIRTLLRNILFAAGYEVTLAHNGESALVELARMPQCDLIISDLQMPVMDGGALCRAVRSSNRPNVPILVVTSVGDGEEKRNALAAGADAYIVKAEFEQNSFLSIVATMAGVAS